MLFCFECPTCEKVTEEYFPIGRAPRVIKCDCGDTAQKLLGTPSFTMNVQFKDTTGTPIWCPSGGYYDRALNRPFKDIREKKEYLKKNKLVMEGSSTSSKDFKKHERSGDFKDKEVRKAMQME